MHSGGDEVFLAIGGAQNLLGPRLRLTSPYLAGQMADQAGSLPRPIPSAMITDVDEEFLIGRAKDGDLESFNRLVLAYQNLVYSVAYRILSEPTAADDATQEAFISAYRNIRRFRGGSFRAWLTRIVTNACYDELRRRKRRPAEALEDLHPLDEPEQADGTGFLASDADSPETAAQRRQLIQAIETCLQNLPDEFRAVAILVDVQGYDYKEASQAIGKPLGTVKSRLARARARLQECLRGYGELLPSAYRLEDEAL